MSILLNPRAWDLVDHVLKTASDYRIESHELKCGARVIDFGVKTKGTLNAGLRLAEICTSGLMEISVEMGQLAGRGWPMVHVRTDHPVEACLYSQYAGWRIEAGKFFAMGSGPMRATAAQEDLFKTLGYKENFYCAVGVLEARQLPDSDIVAQIAHKANIEPRNLMLLVAPTASIAGNLQIVARSVETAMHKLFALGFDVTKVIAGIGSAPLPPIAKDDLAAIGRTNDAILYGGHVHLIVEADDAELAELITNVPSGSSPHAGRPFIELFKDAKYDFYALDPMLFSPASITIENTTSGKVHTAGTVNHEVLKASFGLT
jgi:methenyltetrahydromethanopterin cyclohydrolase